MSFDISGISFTKVNNHIIDPPPENNDNDDEDNMTPTYKREDGVINVSNIKYDFTLNLIVSD